MFPRLRGILLLSRNGVLLSSCLQTEPLCVKNVLELALLVVLCFGGNPPQYRQLDPFNKMHGSDPMRAQLRACCVVLYSPWHRLLVFSGAGGGALV